MTTTKDILKSAITAGVIEAIQSPTTSANQSDQKEIIATVQAAAAPVVAHITNTEPWYQSRVSLGAIIAAAAGIASIFGYAFPAEMQGKVIDAVIALAPLVGGALALYGRWVAKKPLGA